MGIVSRGYFRGLFGWGYFEWGLELALYLMYTIVRKLDKINKVFLIVFLGI